MSRNAGVAAAVAGLLGLVAGLIWGRMARRPVDSVAILGAAAASLIIVINAVFLQSGSQKAPFMANPVSPQLAERRPEAAPSAPASGDAAHAPSSQHAAASAAVRHNDPIGDLIGSTVGSLRGARTTQ